MNVSSRTPEGTPRRCPFCQTVVQMEPSTPPGDAPCPKCGQLLWFAGGMVLEDFEFVASDAIIRDLDASSKPEAIESLLRRLVEVGRLSPDSIEPLFAGLIHREELGSTGIGRGFAIPHIKHPSVEKIVATIGYVSGGIDFEALDGKAVHTIVLMVSPAEKSGDHLRALERISRRLRSLA